MSEKHSTEWHAGNNPDEYFTDKPFAGHLMVYLPNAFQRHKIAWWNCDLPYNGEETGWENFPAWRQITHWKMLDDPSNPHPTDTDHSPA